MAAQATIESQTAGASTEVEILPDIAAEQAALAASLKAGEETPKASAEEPYKPKVEGDVDEAFTIDEFLKQKNTGDKGPKAAEKTEEEEEVVEEPVKPTPVKPGPKPQERVVDDVDEPLRPHLKRMSNEAFNAIKPLLVEAKKVAAEKQQLEEALAAAKKGGLPDNYYEHDMGYVLTPEFERRSTEAQQAQLVLNHWRDQLLKVRSGANEYTPLVQDAQGRLAYGAVTPVDRSTETQLAEYHQWANNQYINAQAKVNSFAESHKERTAEFKSWLSNMEAQAFPQFEKNDQLKASISDTVKQFHPALRHNPAANLLARAFITISTLGAELQKVKGAAPAKPAAPAAKRQPTAAEIAGGGTARVAPPRAAVQYEDGEEDLMDQFKAAKGR